MERRRDAVTRQPARPLRTGPAAGQVRPCADPAARRRSVGPLPSARDGPQPARSRRLLLRRRRSAAARRERSDRSVTAGVAGTAESCGVTWKKVTFPASEALALVSLGVTRPLGTRSWSRLFRASYSSASAFDIPPTLASLSISFWRSLSLIISSPTHLIFSAVSENIGGILENGTTRAGMGWAVRQCGSLLVPLLSNTISPR